MKNKYYHTVHNQSVKVRIRGQLDTTNTRIHDTSRSWIVQELQHNVDGMNKVYRPNTPSFSREWFLFSSWRSNRIRNSYWYYIIRLPSADFSTTSNLNCNTHAEHWNYFHKMNIQTFQCLQLFFFQI